VWIASVTASLPSPTIRFSNQFQLIFLPLLFTLGAWRSRSIARTLHDASMYEWHVYRNDAEKATRYNIFKENVARIDAFNSQSGKSYKLGVNQFADLTNEELKASRNRFKGHMCSPQAGPSRYENVSAVPASVDCRKKGAVTLVKGQGRCGKYSS